MTGRYSYSSVRKYVLEETGVTSGTWTAHRRHLPMPSAVVGGAKCYTEAELRDVLAFWTNWWRTGRGSSLRDQTKVIFADAKA